MIGFEIRHRKKQGETVRFSDYDVYRKQHDHLLLPKDGKSLGGKLYYGHFDGVYVCYYMCNDAVAKHQSTALMSAKA